MMFAEARSSSKQVAASHSNRELLAECQLLKLCEKCRR
jgi:hypothetical protein